MHQIRASFLSTDHPAEWTMLSDTGWPSPLAGRMLTGYTVPPCIYLHTAISIINQLQITKKIKNEKATATKHYSKRWLAQWAKSTQWSIKLEWHRNVFSSRRKVTSIITARMDDNKLFHACGVAAGNAWSPNTDHQMGGTIRVDWRWCQTLTNSWRSTQKENCRKTTL